MYVSPAAAIIASVLLASASPAQAGAFHDAAGKGDVEQVGQLIASGAELDERDRIGTPLHHAAVRGHAAVVALLLEAGAAPDALTRDGATALHRAAYRGDRAIVELLLAAGADPRVESIAEGTPLHLAAMRGHLDLVALLIEHGADVNAQLSIGNGNCPLHAAASAGQVKAAVVLIEAGADLDCVNENTDRPLSTAALSGREAMVALLLARAPTSIMPHRKASRRCTMRSHAVTSTWFACCWRRMPTSISGAPTRARRARRSRLPAGLATTRSPSSSSRTAPGSRRATAT